MGGHSAVCLVECSVRQSGKYVVVCLAERLAVYWVVDSAERMVGK